MAKYGAADVKKLRDATGAGMMECKKALDEADGNYDEAYKIVEAKGLAKAEKKADRETSQGYVASYVHSNGKIGVICELLCETDFVAMNEEFRALAKDIAMQIAAMHPENEAELLEQELIKNPDQTVEVAIKALSGKIGEKIALGRFNRLQIGV
ncbi:MAG: translation elongation factor Ts [Pseudomonadales bacterium]|jgi:elongation factor Ts|nr:translation elongation factor Ts [Pseudomonadales bacterium]